MPLGSPSGGAGCPFWGRLRGQYGLISVSMTFGVSESLPGLSADKLVQIADDNLYKGKKNGKNQVN